MLTRRDILIQAVAAGTAFAKASQPSTPVSFDVPPHACDCHTHIFGDPAKYPLWPGRGYTPEPATPDEMAALHRALRLERVVIVTPSVYGTDNSATLDGMKARGKTARGIAVIDDKTPESALDTMARAGFRGIRLNLTNSGQNDPAIARQRFQSAAGRVKRHDWHIQMNTTLRVISGMKETFQQSAVTVVFDHFAGLDAALGLEQPGFADLLDLVRSGKAYVKLSGAYHTSKHPPITPMPRRSRKR